MELFIHKIWVVLRFIYWNLIALFILPFGVVETLYYGIVYKKWCWGAWVGVGEAWIDSLNEIIHYVRTGEELF